MKWVFLNSIIISQKPFVPTLYNSHIVTIMLITDMLSTRDEIVLLLIDDDVFYDLDMTLPVERNHKNLWQL